MRDEIAANNRRISQKRRIDLPLTQREEEVLEKIAEGATYQEAADFLGIGVSTVHKHMQVIFLKYNVHNRVRAIRLHAVYLRERAESMPSIP